MPRSDRLKSNRRPRGADTGGQPVSARDDVELPRGPEAAAIARRLVRRRLSADVPETVRGGAELIVTELVTNAVVHGVGTIRLRLQSDAGLVRGEVIDQGPGFEVDVREHGVEEIGGRGLWLVSSLARRWGIHDGSSHVWFEFSLRPSAPGPTP